MCLSGKQILDQDTSTHTGGYNDKQKQVDINLKSIKEKYNKEIDYLDDMEYQIMLIDDIKEFFTNRTRTTNKEIKSFLEEMYISYVTDYEI